MRRRTLLLSLLTVLLALGGYTYYTYREIAPEKIHAKNKKAVVFITAHDFGGNPKKSGSGFVVDEDGVIATNYHVISDSADIVIKTLEGRILQVEAVKYFDESTDVALIKVARSKKFGLWSVDLGNPSRISAGDKVYAMGNPDGRESALSKSIVNGFRVWDKESKVIKITAPFSAGSSGGPVFNKRGRVIGISTFIDKDGQNLNFVVPVNYIRNEIAGQTISYTLMPKPPAWELLHSARNLNKYIESWSESFIEPNSISRIAENIKGVWISRRIRYGTPTVLYASVHRPPGRPNSVTDPEHVYAYCNCFDKTITSILFSYTVNDKGAIISKSDKRIEWKELREEAAKRIDEQRNAVIKTKDAMVDPTIHKRGLYSLLEEQSAVLETAEEAEAREQQIAATLIKKVCRDADKR
jgi:hypothetical protein